MAITPLNMGGTGADLSGTGGANQLVKQTASGANFSVATLTTADVSSVGIVKNPTAAQTITGQALTLTSSAPLTLAQMENVQFVDNTLSRGGVDIGDEINKAYAALSPKLATTAASVTSNTATLTMASNPQTFGFEVGESVTVAGFSGADTYFNGVVALTAVTSTTISYSLTHANASATSNGTVAGNTGGTICIAPKPGGGPYNFLTPIVFNAIGKYISLIGLAPANQSGAEGAAGSMGGVTLNFTPTTSSTTLTVSSVAAASGGSAVYAGTITGGGANAFKGKVFYISGCANAVNNGVFVCNGSTATTLTLANGLAVVQATGGTAALLSNTAITWATEPSGGDGGVPSQVFEGICLTNNISTPAIKPGGNGNATIGLDQTASARLTTRNVRISGFGVGKQIISSVTSWGTNDEKMTLWSNNVGLLVHDGIENYSWRGGTVLTNGVGVQVSGSNSQHSGDFKFTDLSFDANTIFGVFQSGTNANIDYTGCHFENAGTAVTSHYHYAQSAKTTIHGGDAGDDWTTGTTDYWFSNGNLDSTGFSWLGVFGLNLSAAPGRVATQIFQIGGQGGFLSGDSQISGGTIPTIYGGLSASKVTSFFASKPTPSTQVVANHYLVSGTGPTVTGTAGLGTGSASLNPSVGSDSCFIVDLNPAGVPGATGNVTVTFASTLGPAVCVPVMTLLNNSGLWTLGSTVIINNVSGPGTTFTFSWNNNGVNLTAGKLYQICVHVFGI